MSLVVPAVLPVSRKDLTEKLALFASLPGVSRVQIDVVDGEFASPASWPYTAPLELRRMVARSEMLPYFDRISYEVDLMCMATDRAASAWLALGARRLTFHAESIAHLPQYLAKARVRYAGDIASVSELVSFGLALNIASDLKLIEPCREYIDYVQFMGIARIGVQGQPFDEQVLPKIRAFHFRHPHIPIQVDGGISLLNAKKLVALGVSNLVVGSAILRASSPSTVLANFESLRDNGTVY